MARARLVSAGQARRRERQRIGLAAVAALAAAATGGMVAAKLGAGRQPAMIVVFGLLLVPLAVWKWPQAAVVGLLAGATTVEQFTYTVGAHRGVFTDKIPLFQSLSNGSFVTPAEMLLAVVLLVWLVKGALERSWHVPRSRLAAGVAAMYGTVLLVGLGLGLARHGKLSIAMWEVRPWYYVAVMYLLVSSFFAGRNMVRTLLWTMVLGTGFKSVQGVIIYFTVARKMIPRPEAILGHEESFFFAMFVISTLGLWAFGIRGPLRLVASALLPFVVVADLGNSRRTAFLLLFAGIIILLVMGYRCLPERRRRLKRLNIALIVVGAVYLPLFWNSSGSLGQPARAVQSAIAPSARDRESNLYRYIENADLLINIHSSRSIGKGFGIPIDYSIKIVNLTGIDSAIAFIPHNGVLYLWFRLGILGELIFWTMIGFGVLAASRLSLEADKEVQFLGMLAVCALISYLLIGYNDMGFFWGRIALFVGFMLGAVEAASQRPGLRAGGRAADLAASVGASAGLAS